VPEDIDVTLCTHIVYAFAKLEDGVLAPTEWNDETTPWSKGMMLCNPPELLSVKRDSSVMRNYISPAYGTSALTWLAIDRPYRHIHYTSAHMDGNKFIVVINNHHVSIHYYTKNDVHENIFLDAIL